MKVSVNQLTSDTELTMNIFVRFIVDESRGTFELVLLLNIYRTLNYEFKLVNYLSSANRFDPVTVTNY